MSRRKFRLTARKNWERKKYGSRHAKPEPEPEPESLVVSIPLSICLPTSIDGLRNVTLPSSWSFAPTEDSSTLHVCKMIPGSAGSPVKVYATIEVRSTLEWNLFIHSHELKPKSHPELRSLPNPIRRGDDLISIVQCVNGCTLCIGNNDEMFTPLVERHKGDFRDPTGLQVAVYDQDNCTVRHTGCQLLLSSGNRCAQCTTYRNNSLRREANRLKQMGNCKENSDPSNPSSHVNYRFLTTPERNVRIRKLHDQVRVKEKSLQAMRKQINRMVQNGGVNLDTDLHNDLISIMKSASAPSDTFLSLFWSQQLKASSLRDSRSMRWHPVLIKWCLLLFRKSSSAYELIRKTGVLKLPSGRTLRDYSHYSASVPGFTATSDVQLLEARKQTKPQHLSHHVLLLIDEMYVKEGLVYNKTTGALVGFIDLGDINNCLCEAERRPIAKTVAVIMVRGVFSNLEFPYAVFPAVSLSGSDLYPLMWEAIGRLTLNGFRVHAVTADGAKPNRKLFRLHHTKSKVTFKVENVFDPERHPIYFISDPPHLIKTIRNCLASDKRNLWCQGQSISFEFIIQLYERKFSTVGDSPGLTLVPKLSFEHVKLTSFSKMRVDLAAQTLSESVSNALYLTGGSKAFETAYFVGKVDKLFDCLNVSSYSQGKLKRKPFQQPYRSPNDFRLKYMRDFLKYLDAWEDSVSKREGFTDAEKKRMLLSEETRTGIRMTVLSFLELVPLLLKFQGAHYFLSAKLNQDPLEKFFGRVRQFGRVNENPTVAEFLKSTQALKVIDSIHLDDIKGNCRGQKRKGIEVEDIEFKPLHKRSRQRRPSK